TAATEFAAAISQIRHLSYQVRTGVQTTELGLKFQEAHTGARVEYERLRLLCESLTAQEAARFALRHAYNTWTVANDTSRRMDEYATVGPWEQCDERLKDMFVVVRRELSRLPEVLHVTSVTGLAARQGREGHAGECFGGLPEAAGERLVVGGLGVVDLAGQASGLTGPAGAVVVAALDLRVGGGPPHRQRAASGGLADQLREGSERPRGDAAAAQPWAAVLQLGAAVAGVGAGAEGAGARGAQAAVQLQGEQRVGQLGLVVGLPRAVAALALQVIQSDGAHAVVEAADRHHPAERAGQQGRQQPSGEREVSQVVGAQLQLEALGGCLALGHGHHPGVVDQQVQAVVAVQELVG